jgi:hypothetical protein
MVKTTIILVWGPVLRLVDGLHKLHMNLVHMRCFSPMILIDPEMGLCTAAKYHVFSPFLSVPLCKKKCVTPKSHAFFGSFRDDFSGFFSGLMILSQVPPLISGGS